MSDDRNDGSVPPPAASAPPPPLAGSPPPVVPPQPVPQPAPQPYPTPGYPAPAGGGKTGLWVLFIILAFAAGVGATILTLWLTGDLWNSRSDYSSSSFSSSPTPSPSPSPGGTGTTGGTSYSTPPPPPAAGGYAPTPETLHGTWGPGCPGSTNDALTLYADGSATSDGENGTWSLSGNYLTLNNGREVMTLYWEMVTNDMARVRRSGDSRTRTISRCS